MRGEIEIGWRGARREESRLQWDVCEYGLRDGDSVGEDGSVRHGSSRGSERIDWDDRDSISKQGLPAQIQRRIDLPEIIRQSI
jgi:hypothetical protein